MKFNQDLVKKIKADYLTAEELADILRLETPRTVHNWNSNGVFEQGKEVVKLRGVLLFYWPAIRERLHTIDTPTKKDSPSKKRKSGPRPDGCLINL